MNLSSLTRELLLTTVLMISISGVAAAQAVARPASTARKPLAKKPKPLSRELSVGFKLTTDGVGIFVDKGLVNATNPKTQEMFYNLRLFQVGLEEHKHPKEVKRSFTDNSGSGEKTKPFIFGKLNNFYALKLGYGFRRMIAGKPEQGTVSIHWTGIAGASVGLEKPYYIEAYAPADNTSGPLVRKSIKYSDDTKPYFLNPYYIVGSSGFAKGLGEVKVVPGVQASTALHFDFAPSKRNVMALETGISAELYTRAIELMANQDSKPYFVNLYASFQFGWRK